MVKLQHLDCNDPVGRSLGAGPVGLSPSMAKSLIGSLSW